MKTFVYSILIFFFILAIITGILHKKKTNAIVKKMRTIYNKSEKNIKFKCKHKFYLCLESRTKNAEICFLKFQSCMKESK